MNEEEYLEKLMEDLNREARETIQLKHARPFKRKETDMKTIAGNARPHFDELRGYKTLARMICTQAVEDYLAGIDEAENERFIRGETFELFSGMDGAEVMETLKRRKENI